MPGRCPPHHAPLEASQPHGPRAQERVCRRLWGKVFSINKAATGGGGGVFETGLVRPKTRPDLTKVTGLSRSGVSGQFLLQQLQAA